MKPTRKEMLDFIYKKVANKDLSFGCKLLNPHSKQILKFSKRSSYNPKENIEAVSVYWNYLIIIKKDLFEIIWHDVLIWDVFNWTWWNIYSCEDCWSISRNAEIFKLWEYKCKPIDDQSDECIEYIYNLLKNYETTR